MNKLFITGQPRSGTTLLDKILYSHENGVVGSHPFPFLFLHLKQKFLADLGLHRNFPLDHLFLEQGYRPDDFNRFLEEHKIVHHQIDKIFEMMTGYSGQYMPGFLEFVKEANYAEGKFAAVLSNLISILLEYENQPNIQFAGIKEVFCEEYIPHLLTKNYKVIVIIRDPRDMITSMIGREGRKFVGKAKPLLFILRHWRKSVSFCLNYESDSNFMFIRYEDLIQHSENTLHRISSFLSIPKFKEDHLKDEIKDQRGNIWTGNSSFGEFKGISSNSIGNFRRKLDPSTIHYIESLCLPEMTYLGYSLEYGSVVMSRDSLRDFREAYPIRNSMFNGDYSYNARNIDDELQRILYISQQPSESVIKEWFIFLKTYSKLRR